jgi:hypothetical protein
MLRRREIEHVTDGGAGESRNLLLTEPLELELSEAVLQLARTGLLRNESNWQITPSAGLSARARE